MKFSVVFRVGDDWFEYHCDVMANTVQGALDRACVWFSIEHKEINPELIREVCVKPVL